MNSSFLNEPLFVFTKLTWNVTFSSVGKLASVVMRCWAGRCLLHCKEHGWTNNGKCAAGSFLDMPVFPCRRAATHHQAEALEPLWCTCGKVWLAPWRCCTVHRFPDPDVRNGSRKTSLSWRMPSASLVEFLADSAHTRSELAHVVQCIGPKGGLSFLTGLQVSWLHPQTFYFALRYCRLTFCFLCTVILGKGSLLSSA